MTVSTRHFQRYLGIWFVLFMVQILVSRDLVAEQDGSSKDQTRPARVTVRCAVISGMTDTGLWSAISERFEAKTGYAIEVVAQGNKRVIVPLFEQGKADLLTMHASDAIINLVADGFGEDPQPWARND